MSINAIGFLTKMRLNFSEASQNTFMDGHGALDIVQTPT